MSKFKFPTAFTILFVLIAIVAGLTHIIPAGKYDRQMNDALGREVPVAGTYHTVDSNPQGFGDVLLAPINGLYDINSYSANAIDVALFVLIIGGFLMVVTKTGAIDAGIGALLKKLEGREQLMIPLLMACFALGGTSYGMAEESLAFYAVIIPVFIRAGYDSVTGVATIMLGCGIGVLGSTVNAFATVIASNAAGVPFTDGMTLRFIILIVGELIGMWWVMRYAARVKADKSNSIVADMWDDNREHFLKGSDGSALPEFTITRKLIMVVFAATFGIMIYGVVWLGWWMGRMSALFLLMSIIVWIVGKFGEETRMDENTFVDTFVDGARDLLGVALIIGVARGIVIVMDAGSITDTILHACEDFVGGLSEFAFINVMFLIQILLSFLVPSSSGLAVLTMPIMAPLADFANVGRELVVTAYQSANGLVNLFNPTFAVVMGGLAIGRVGYDKWLRFVFPLVIVLAVMIMVLVSIAAAMG